MRCIEAIDPANVNASASLAAEYYYLKARMHALRGERAAWHEAMEAGLARNAERKPLSDDSRIALSNATIEALALGEMQLARAYQRRALGVARALKSGIDFEETILAHVELLAGELEPARKRLKTSAPPVRFSGRIYYLGALTLLAALTGDDALAGSIDADAIEQAAGGGRAASLVQLAGPFAFGLDRLGRTREARALAKLLGLDPGKLADAAARRWEPHVALFAGDGLEVAGGNSGFVEMMGGGEGTDGGGGNCRW